MFGIRYVKFEPNQYILQYKGGQLVREGAGLSFFYFSPTTSLVCVPTASSDAPFIFNEVTSDFQQISFQGQITYVVSDPKKLAKLLNFTLNETGQDYVSDDPEKFPQRIINMIQVLVRAELQSLALKEVLRSSENLVRKLRQSLASSESMVSLGVEILGLSILAIKPNPDTARALEAAVREQLLRDADQAIYSRRNSAVEQERAIKENELNTEIAVENKKREIRETQMEAERAVEAKRQQLQKEQMAGKIQLEEKNKELVQLSTENAKKEADAKAYGMQAVMKAMSGVDPKVLQSIASVGMDPSQLIATAFRELAQSSEKIGQLNISPDLLRELMEKKAQK